MITLDCLPHDRLELGIDEVGDLDDLGDLPWVEAGVARIGRTRIGVEIRLGPYVGRLVIPGRVQIDVNEPFPGTVSTCLDISSTGRRAADQQSLHGRVLVRPWTAIATRFARLLSRYASTGIERSYRSRTITTTRPRGRVDVTTTALRLASHGRSHQVICKVRPLTDDTPLNRAIVGGAMRAEQLLVRSNEPQSLALLRQSMMALTGVRRDVAPDFISARMEEQRDYAEHGSLLSLAELLVSGVPALPRGEQQQSDRPMSAWLNVERLFEEAVLALARSVGATTGAVVHAGRGDGVHLFSRRAGDPQTVRKAADPDVVIRADDRVLLIDAKYRRHAGDFTEDELYQLMAHATAYGARAAALVAPDRVGAGATTRWLGRDRNGVAYYMLTVDPTTVAGVEQPIASWMTEQLMRH